MLSHARLGLLFLAGLLASPLAQACPAFLKDVQSPTAQAFNTTLCELYDRYQNIKDLYGIIRKDPEQIRAVRAPRFIRASEYFGEKGRSKNFDPWLIYDPAPKTWQKWEDAEAIVRAAVERNLRVGIGYGIDNTYESPAPITEGLLKQIHLASIKGLPSEALNFRTNDFVGLHLSRQDAVPANGDSEITYSGDPAPLVKWHYIPCLEDMTPEERAAAEKKELWKIKEKSQATFTGKRCGWYTYPNHTEIPARMKLWEKRINEQLIAWYSRKNAGDPVALAAEAQRWLVAIHPFADGNGRTSRFMMDYILMSLGLPAPSLVDMDQDLVLSQKEWSREVMRGMLNTVQTLEWCYDQLSHGGWDNPYCQETTRAKPSKSLAKLLRTIEKDLKPVMTSRMVYLYHHFTPGTLDKTTPGFSEWMKKFLELRTNQARDPNFTRLGGFAGDGVYTALEPAVGLSFGSGMYEIAMRAGTRLVNGERLFSEKTLDLLWDWGCHGQSLAAMINTNGACQWLAKKFLSEAGIDGFSYTWGDRSACYNSKAVQPSISIVLVNSKNISSANTSFFDSDSRFSFTGKISHDPEFVKRYLRFKGLGESNFPSDIKVTPADIQQETEFQKQHFLGCGDYKEDRYFY